MPRYNILYTLIFAVAISYNPLERREASKGGREVSKKGVQSQASSKGAAAAAPKSHASHNARRIDTNAVNNVNQSGKSSRPSSSGGPPPPAYDEQVTFY